MNMKIRKILSAVLSMALVISLFSGMCFVTASAEDACGYTANGTVSSLFDSGADAASGEFYSISSQTDLINLASYINSDKPCEGVTFYLTKDIDMTGIEWTPIGDDSDNAFMGTFDGCGFAVLNLVAEAELYNDVALFGYVSGPDTVIKNLGVMGEIIGNNTVAGIAANVEDAGIYNCWNAVDVTGGSNIGGIAGVITDGTIENCCNFAYISGNSNVGAVAGKVAGSSTIEYSYYVYYSADKACGSISSGSTVSIFRFASSSTEVLTEKELTVDKTATDDLVVLLNDWVDMQDNDFNYREWIYDTSASGNVRVDGRYPSHEYPGYIAVKDSMYTADATMTQLWEMQESAAYGGYYSISSATEMYYFADYVNMGYNTSGATFFLTADIVIGSGATSAEQVFWTPIGSNDDVPFCGVFDGQGYICNGTMLDGTDDLGLFGFVDDQNAVIKNVGVINIITGNDQLGGIVANLINGSIINCWYDGSVTGDDRVGGIAGNVENGRIYNCVNYASVVGNSTYGGIFGDSNSSTIAKYCYYTNNNSTGCGSENGTTTAILSFSESGADFELERAVSIGTSTNIKLLNALNSWVNTDALDDTYRNWKIDTSSESLLRVGGKHPTHLYPGDNSGLKTVDEPYSELEETGNPYDVHYLETATMTELYDSNADGIKGGHYSINNGDEMELLAEYVNAGHSSADIVFYLTDDITIAAQCAALGEDGWMPIGRDADLTDPDTYVKSFRGVFDGCGYTIYGLAITKNEADDAGLFGHCDNAVIKNLGVVGNIVAENKVGGIAATVEDSTIINCWAAVNIQAEDRVGGIAGRITDTNIINCVSYGTMLAYGGSSSAVAGGIFGVGTGTCNIEHCYYIDTTFNQAYQKVDDDSTVDATYFTYGYENDDYVCTLEHAVAVEDVSTTNLLSALNAWVYAQNTTLYAAWYISSTTISIGSGSGHVPKLMNPELTESGENEDYSGDYTATCSIKDLYSTRTDGIEGCCYSINGLEDLEAFQKYVNDGYKTEGIIFFMTRDIDMSSSYSADTGRSWTPIGNVDEPFTGIFDGQGYTIKYLYINTTDDDQGLFGHVSGTKTIIKNLGICGTVLADNNAGGIVGDFNFATIANCWVSCEVTALDGNAGGIVGGANNGTIVNCTNYGVVADSKAFGAIAGYAVGTTMKYCYYLYATCQQAYSGGSVVSETGVQYFNGTSAACVMHEKITVEGTETKNVLSALKLYVDAHPETNYCYWTIGNTEEYMLMGVEFFPVLISASGTMGETDYNQVLAYYNGKEYNSLVTAVNDANDNPDGGDVTLATNVVLKNKENISPDENVRIVTGDYTLNIKSVVTVYSMQQLEGVFILNKDGGSIYTWDTENDGFKLFMYCKKDTDPSCNSEIYGTQSLTFSSTSVKGNFPYAYNLTLQDGEYFVNSTLDSGNPHKIPAGSTLTIDSRATLNVLANARIRTTGNNSVIMNYGTVKIGNATLDCNGGTEMRGVLEDDGGVVSLPYVYRDGYTLRGWSDGVNTYAVGSTADVQSETTLTALWKIGEGADPYPGDDYYTDQDMPIYNIPITVIQSAGGTITPGSIKAAKGENITLSFSPESGYYIKNVLVDGESVELTENYTYQLVSISREHTIVALFAPDTNTAYQDWENPFEDITEDDWCYDYVRYVSSAGLFNGTSETTFSPNKTMTRDMVVVVLWRLSGCPVVPDNGVSFTDVAKTSYAYDAVRWANQFGIVKGFSETTFGYGRAVTREQLITFLYRYAKNYAGDDVGAYDNVNILGYTDVLQISKGMTQPFQWGIGAGIVNGTSATTLSPKTETTRAQVAAILTRYCNTFLLTVPVTKD